MGHAQAGQRWVRQNPAHRELSSQSKMLARPQKMLKVPVKSSARGHPARGGGHRRLSPQDSRQQGKSCSQNTGSLSRLLEEHGGCWRVESRCRQRRPVSGAWEGRQADECARALDPLGEGSQGALSGSQSKSLLFLLPISFSPGNNTNIYVNTKIATLSLPLRRLIFQP